MPLTSLSATDFWPGWNKIWILLFFYIPETRKGTPTALLLPDLCEWCYLKLDEINMKELALIVIWQVLRKLRETLFSCETWMAEM